LLQSLLFILILPINSFAMTQACDTNRYFLELLPTDIKIQIHKNIYDCSDLKGLTKEYQMFTRNLPYSQLIIAAEQAKSPGLIYSLMHIICLPNDYEAKSGFATAISKGNVLLKLSKHSWIQGLIQILY
jgi:hypothetical protein